MSYLHTKDHISSILNDAEKEQIENEEERNILLAHSKAAEVEGGQKFVQILKNNERGWTNQDVKGNRDAFTLNNKHEALFCCGRNGVNAIILNTTHLMYVAIISIVAFKIVTLGSDIRLLSN